jgi:hypothetical protein
MRDSICQTLVYGLVTLVLAVGVVAVPATAAPVYFADTDHYYEFVSTPNSIAWTDARLAAEQRSLYGASGYLVTVTSVDENSFILAMLQAIVDPTPRVLLGAYQDPAATTPDTGWQWVSGESWDYTNWVSTEPNNSGGNEDVLEMKPTGEWNDLPGSTPYPGIGGYVVEYNVPEPATLSLIALGLLALRRRR